MTWHDWLSLAVEISLIVAVLFGCAWLGQWMNRKLTCWWIRRERDRIAAMNRRREKESTDKLWPEGTLYGYRQTGPASGEFLFTFSIDDLRRAELKRISASDKAARKIVH